MHFSGIIVGAAVFFCIGICHPAVIKMEYHLGKKSWWIWLVVGLLVACASLFVPNQTVSTILGGFAFSCFWGILEMHQANARARRPSLSAKWPPSSQTSVLYSGPNCV